MDLRAHSLTLQRCTLTQDMEIFKKCHVSTAGKCIFLFYIKKVLRDTFFYTQDINIENLLTNYFYKINQLLIFFKKLIIHHRNKQPPYLLEEDIHISFHIHPSSNLMATPLYPDFHTKM